MSTKIFGKCICLESEKIKENLGRAKEKTKCPSGATVIDGAVRKRCEGKNEGGEDVQNPVMRKVRGPRNVSGDCGVGPTKWSGTVHNTKGGKDSGKIKEVDIKDEHTRG